MGHLRGARHGLNYRTTGWPKGREPYGHGASIVVSGGVTPTTRRREAGSSDTRTGRYAKCRTLKLS